MSNTDITPVDSPSESTASTAKDNNGDTAGATALVSEVIQGAKSVVDDALSWAEKKVGSLGLEQGGTGPYDSPATCMPADLDAIASGILPAIPNKEQGDEDAQDKNEKNESNKGKEEDAAE